MLKKYDLPAMPFYVGDWLKCPEVRALPPDYRGLWFDLICFMWESTERGVMVKPNGKPYSDSDIIRMVGLDNQNSGIWLTHLLENEVCSRRNDGCVYSKRMVKDEELRVLRRKVGKKGGNPNLLVNYTLNQEVNQNIENEDVNEDVNVIKKRNYKRILFIPPTLEEVKKYFTEKKTKIDPVAFHAHYETNGWKQGAGRPIKNWKACLVTWEQRRKEFTPTETPHGKPPAEIVAIQCVAMRMSDEDIKAHMIDKGYTEHRAVEAIMRARGKNE